MLLSTQTQEWTISLDILNIHRNRSACLALFVGMKKKKKERKVHSWIHRLVGFGRSIIFPSPCPNPGVLNYKLVKREKMTTGNDPSFRYLPKLSSRVTIVRSDWYIPPNISISFLRAGPWLCWADCKHYYYYYFFNLIQSIRFVSNTTTFIHGLLHSPIDWMRLDCRSFGQYTREYSITLSV